MHKVAEDIQRRLLARYRELRSLGYEPEASLIVAAVDGDGNPYIFRYSGGILDDRTEDGYAMVGIGRDTGGVLLLNLLGYGPEATWDMGLLAPLPHRRHSGREPLRLAPRGRGGQPLHPVAGRQGGHGPAGARGLPGVQATRQEEDTADTRPLATGRDAGEEAVGQIPWERYVVDPTPGPVPPDALREVAKVGDGLYLATPRSYVERGGRRFKTQGMCVAEALNKSVYLVDPYRRPSELAKTLAGFGRVVGVDVGGDVLGVGCEESLGSPLADAYGLAVLARLAEMGAETELWVMSPGADGELDREYVLHRAATAARAGGLIGLVGLARGEVEVLSRLVETCITEASAVAVRAFRGEHGVSTLRGGLRELRWISTPPPASRLDPKTILG